MQAISVMRLQDEEDIEEFAGELILRAMALDRVRCAYLNIRCIESPYLDHLCVFLLNHPEAAKSCFFDPANLARGE